MVISTGRCSACFGTNLLFHAWVYLPAVHRELTFHPALELDRLLQPDSPLALRVVQLVRVGHTRAILDANGNILAQQAYTPYGQQLGATLPTPFAWNGACGIYTDPETGLLYIRARYYSPSIGRFISRDPIGFDGGINLYVYCSGDPVNWVDPDGLKPVSFSPPIMTIINDNITETRNHTMTYAPGVGAVSSDSRYQTMNYTQGTPMGIYWWYKRVRSKGVWDNKITKSLLKHDSHVNCEDVGNFNFGATGAALGIPLNVLQGGAGFAKWLYYPNISWLERIWAINDNVIHSRYPYGDDMSDASVIKHGYDYAIQTRGF